MLSPGGLLLGVADARDFPHTSHHHPEAVVSSQDLDCTAHGDGLQADAVHLHQLVPDTQACLLWMGGKLGVGLGGSGPNPLTNTCAHTNTHIFCVQHTCGAEVLNLTDEDAEAML